MPNVEFLVSRRQNKHLPGLGLDAKILITSVIPTALSQARHVLAGFKSGQRRGTLHITIEVVNVGRRHECIIHMTDVMPELVFFLHPHVAHLYRQKIVQRRLPNILVINIRGYAERFTLLLTQYQLIHSLFLHVGEVEVEIFVAQKIAPGLGFFIQHYLVIAILAQAQQLHFVIEIIVGVSFDYRHFFLRRMVTNHGMLNDRLVDPVSNYIRFDGQFNGFFRSAGGYSGAHNKPAVLVQIATIV